MNQIYNQNEEYYNELIQIIHTLKIELNKSNDYIINMLSDENLPNYIMNDLLNKV